MVTSTSVDRPSVHGSLRARHCTASRRSAQCCASRPQGGAPVALDPRIPLGVQAPQQQTSPLELYSQILQIQNQRENIAALGEERRANAALTQQRIAENQRVLQGRSALVKALAA